MNAPTLLKFPVSLIPPPDDRFHAYHTYVWAATPEDAHKRALETMTGHDEQNRGFWYGWCYSIGIPTVR